FVVGGVYAVCLPLVFFPVVEAVDSVEAGEDAVLPGVVGGFVFGEDGLAGGGAGGGEVGGEGGGAGGLWSLCRGWGGRTCGQVEGGARGFRGGYPFAGA